MATYTIQINLGGNLLTQLKEAERIADKLDGKRLAGGRATYVRSGEGGAGGARATNPYPYIPPNARPSLNRIYDNSRLFGNSLTKDQFNQRFNNAFQSIRTFQSDFVKNTFSISGWGRNVGNFTKVLGTFSKALSAAGPYLEVAMKGLKLYAASYAVPAIVGGIAYSAGAKVLTGENIGQAVSDRFQLEAAEKGLGSIYSKALKDAFDISAQYGIPRASAISNLNVMSGFETENGAISYDRALSLTKSAGVISGMSNRPFDLVAMNLQQILAASQPNMRDIRELLHQAPILSKYALQDMKQQGIKGDPREYYKDRENLLKSLDRLLQEFQIPRTQEIRGGMELRKRDFWMHTEKAGAPLWEDINRAQERLYQVFATGVDKFMASYDSAKMNELFDSFVNGVEWLLDILPDATDAIITFVDAFGQIKDIFNGINSFLNGFVKWGAGDKSWTQDWQKMLDAFNGPKDRKKLSATRSEGRETYFPKYVNTLVQEQVNPMGMYDNSKEYQEKINAVTKEITAKYYPKANWDNWSKKGGNSLFNLWNLRSGSNSSNFPFNSDMGDRDAMIADIKAAFGGLNATGLTGLNGDDTHEIEDLTKGSKSLIVNFNAPLVEMDNTYNTGADAESIRNLIERDIDSMISRGFQIAMNNSTKIF